jgi:hypothetical protein
MIPGKEIYHGGVSIQVNIYVPLLKPTLCFGITIPASSTFSFHYRLLWVLLSPYGAFWGSSKGFQMVVVVKEITYQTNIFLYPLSKYGFVPRSHPRVLVV